MDNPIPNGTKTGRVDHDGKEISCGDRVRLYERKPETFERYSEDQYGNRTRLEKPVKIEAEEKITEGTVAYSPERTGFVVVFDSFMLNSGNQVATLYLLLGPVSMTGIQRILRVI